MFRDPGAEWLEADGLGGFASGTVSGIRSRRYHALLLAATRPPAGRVVLVNGFDAWVETSRGTYPISSQRYGAGVVHPDGSRRLAAFAFEPWPCWTFGFEDGTRLVQELLVRRGSAAVALSWRLLTPDPTAVLRVRPFLSGRDYHSLHHENPEFRFPAEAVEGGLAWRPYPGLPRILAWTNGVYTPEPHWYRNFFYTEEEARGVDFLEDLAAPGVFRWDLGRGEAVLILAAEGVGPSLPSVPGAEAQLEAFRLSERPRRDAFPSRLHRAGDAYLVGRGGGKTVVAGYPWFLDWGRDTFIALRGLCLAAGRVDAAGDILEEWTRAVSLGMLPNRFPDRAEEEPEFNSVDAALWYVIAAHEYLQAAAGKSGLREALGKTIRAVLEGYTQGTRHGIRLDADGLLAAGEPGLALTWMDAKVAEGAVTPRIGKPVEVQALWLNALKVGSAFWDRGAEAFARGVRTFELRFWNEAQGCLYDVVDDGHRGGAVDPAFRPNQIFAVGGLPLPLLTGPRARRLVDAVEERLLTPLGLRSLAREEPGYRPRYEGGVRERDGAYHQGTVWPWLLGPFVEAWVRVRGSTTEAKAEARRRFLVPLLRHLDEAGLGHVSELADGDAPHQPRGCPFQAWSVAEALRLDRVVLAEGASAGLPKATPPPKH
ncbi:MAG TPA: amylo-alpha-1,6-glucosidase [Vicinamibacteria bacterium]|nr:amylo-alpha-1,6-glucosidase [Vicinamibacteria bacterium]